METHSSRLKNLSENVKLKKGEVGYKIDEEERAIINVGAENFDDIFSPYCYKGGDSLKMELVDYIEEKAACVPLSTDLTIIFHVKNSDEVKRKEVSDALIENYENEINGINQRMRRNTVFALWLLLAGLSLFVAYVLLKSFVPFYVDAILEILTWVFIWESLDKFFLDRRLLQLEKLKKYRLINAKIKVLEFVTY